MPDEIAKPTLVEAFEAGRYFLDWMATLRERDGEAMVRKELPLFLMAIGVRDMPGFVRAVRGQSLSELELARHIYKKSDAENLVDATVAQYGVPLTQWFSVGKEFDRLQGRREPITYDNYPGWAAPFRKTMEEAGVSLADRDAVSDLMRSAITTPGYAQGHMFERAAERLRESARKLQSNKLEKITPSVTATAVEKFTFLVAIMIGAGGGFYLFSTQWWLAALWFAFFVVTFPLVWSFIFRADDMPGSDLKTIYKTGVKRIPFIGRLLASPARVPVEAKTR